VAIASLSRYDDTAGTHVATNVHAGERAVGVQGKPARRLVEKPDFGYGPLLRKAMEALVLGQHFRARRVLHL
jgi:hypothetical protein